MENVRTTAQVIPLRTRKPKAKRGEPTKHGSNWRIRWTDEQGCRHSEVHPTPKDARLALKRHQVEVEERKRGLRKMAPASVALSDVWARWRELRGTRKRSGDTDESFWRVHLGPSFGHRVVSEISADDVERYQNDRGHLEPTTVHHHLTLLITLLRFAKDRGWMTELPKIQKPRLVLQEEDFSYLRTDVEIRRFLDAAKAEGAFLFMLYAVPIYSGLRLGEVCGLSREDVDLGQRLITVRRSFGGPTKSGKARQVPILDPLLDHLRAWLALPGPDLLFASERGRLLRRDSPYFKKERHLGRVLSNAGFSKAYVTYHDLRHTFASHWMMRGGDIYKLQKILGHESVETTQRYAHLAPSAFAEDYARFSPLAGTAAGV